MTVALSVTSLLLVAIGSAMLLTSQAVPDGTGPASTAAELGDALARMSEELQYAQYVAERDEHAVTFTVADRTGDGSPQRIRYAWSGEPGDPLTRQLDDHDPVPVVDELSELTLTYYTQQATRRYPGAVTEGPVQLLAESASGETDVRSVRSSRSIGQYIHPAIDTEAVGWRPTRVEFRARRPLLSSGSFHVQLRHAALDDTPDEPESERVLVQDTLSADLLTLSFSWREAEFSNAPVIPTRMPVGLAFVHDEGNSPIARLEYYQNTDVGGMSTDNGDGNWSIEPTNTLRYRLYGRVTEPGPDQTFDRRFLTAVGATLRSGEPASTTMAAEIELTNRPEILAGYWRTDFRHDPTQLDVNADQVPDWIASNTFDPDSLSDGVWHADRTLVAYPTDELSGPLRARIRMRHTANDGGAAVAWLYVDRTDGTLGNILPMVQHQGDGKQVLLLYSQRDDGSWNLLQHVSNLPDDEFVDVQLRIDPSHGTVHLRVDGLDRGTHHYEVQSASSGNGLLALGHSGSNVEFQYAEFAVSRAP